MQVVRRSVLNLPFIETLRTSNPESVRHDAVAALTTAAMLVPQAMAYAALAELPPYVGLYAATLPLLLYALLGRTPELAIGPVAMASLMLASGVTHFAQPHSAEYLEISIQLAFMVGAMQMAVGILRLGFLTTLISYPVMSGFTSAAAVLIALSQLPHALGFKVPHGPPLQTLQFIYAHIGSTQAIPLLLTVGGVAVLASCKRWLPKAPGALIVLVI
ncbi:MAG: SulP family inorganic anion transporter, partial [Myxococcales bacterium]|nr:SulP family inorganic anion transporter [Myxococcales bacterium]